MVARNKIECSVVVVETASEEGYVAITQQIQKRPERLVGECVTLKFQLVLALDKVTRLIRPSAQIDVVATRDNGGKIERAHAPLVHGLGVRCVNDALALGQQIVML